MLIIVRFVINDHSYYNMLKYKLFTIIALGLLVSVGMLVGTANAQVSTD